MPTIRNARGSDLIVTDADEKTFFGGAFWLNPPAYDRDKFREAWDRIGASPS